MSLVGNDLFGSVENIKKGQNCCKFLGAIQCCPCSDAPSGPGGRAIGPTPPFPRVPIGSYYTRLIPGLRRTDTCILP